MIQLRPEATEARLMLIQYLETRDDQSQRANEIRILADLQIRQGQRVEAVASLRQLIALTPDDPEVRRAFVEVAEGIVPAEELTPELLRLAVGYAHAGDMEESRTRFDRLLAVAPQDLPVREAYFEFLRTQDNRPATAAEGLVVSQLLFDRGFARKALEVLESIRLIVGRDADFSLRVGRVHAALNSRGFAARELRLAAELFRQSNRTNRELEVLEELLKIDPLNLEARQRQIEVLLAQGDKAAAPSLLSLADMYNERGLPDLAELEVRRLLELDPNTPAHWHKLFETKLKLVPESELVADYLEFAEQMARAGEASLAVKYFQKAGELNPREVRAWRGYVVQYPKIGKLRDIVDDVLTFAQLLMETGDADEAARYFQLVMSIDPTNTLAREMLSATQSRAAGAPTPTADADSSEIDLSGTQQRMITSQGPSASEYLAGAMQSIDREENSKALRQVVMNYRDILAVNSQNAAVRLKLAEVLEQMGDITEALQELMLASETLFAKEDLVACVATCERYLRLNPGDQRVRKRLSEAVVKRDAFKALESAIIYSDNPAPSASHNTSGVAQRPANGRL